jgi:hypothetical protein
MKRRVVLAITAAAVLAGGVGAASAATTPRQHQLCVILYDTHGGPDTPLCVNW